VDGAPTGAAVVKYGLGDGDGDGLAVAVGVGGGVVGTVVVVTVAVPDGALAVKKLDDADAPAIGVPDPVQAEVASAANIVTALQSTAAVPLRTLARPANQRTPMNPPTSQPLSRPRKGSSPGPAYANRHWQKRAR
jgi:hypothetical protein